MKVKPKLEPEKVKIFGDGVSQKGIPASIPAEFTVDTSDAGFGDLEVQVLVSLSRLPLFNSVLLLYLTYLKIKFYNF